MGFLGGACMGEVVVVGGGGVEILGVWGGGFGWRLAGILKGFRRFFVGGVRRFFMSH